jgi:hypothetical protein
MVRRITIASVWFWGFWAFGSTLEFFRVAPSWPAIAAGLVGGIAILTLMGIRSSTTEPAQLAARSADDINPAPLS